MGVSVRVVSVTMRDDNVSVVGWSTADPGIQMSVDLYVYGAGGMFSAAETVERMLADPVPAPRVPQLGDALTEDPGNGVVIAGYKGRARVRWARDMEGYWWPLSAEYQSDGYIWDDLENPVLIISPNRTWYVEE